MRQQFDLDGLAHLLPIFFFEQLFFKLASLRFDVLTIYWALRSRRNSMFTSLTMRRFQHPDTFGLAVFFFYLVCAQRKIKRFPPRNPLGGGSRRESFYLWPKNLSGRNSFTGPFYAHRKKTPNAILRTRFLDQSRSFAFGRL